MLALAAAVLAGRWSIIRTPDRIELGSRPAEVRFERVELDAAGFGPLRLAAAWSVSVDDPRFGGISALALDRGGFLALSDSGVLIRLPKPGGSGLATLRELPGGPGPPGFKRNRDSEALVRDPDGSGWWVGFENRHSLWKYDGNFTRTLGSVDLGERGWGVNKGVEGLAMSGTGLLVFPETGGTIIAVGDGSTKTVPLNSARRIADAASLGDGGVVLLQRQPTPTGFRNSLAWLEAGEDGYRLVRPVQLGVGPLVNLEALAVERTAAGVRLWLMSDNNFHRAQRTLLVALDIPPG